ncbi:MAG: hypothetical protein ABIQ52_13945 [Vicinamibacterales bacterium]
MLTSLLLSAVLIGQGQVVVEGGPPPAPVPKDAPRALPDTPQGKHVKTYIEAFNAGDEKKFMAVQETLFAPEALARRTAADRSKMFNRMKGDFGTLVVKRAIASPGQIRAVMADKEGNDAIFTFDFATTAPFRIKGIGVDIGNVER